MCRIASNVLPIATAYITPSTLPKCGFSTVPHPPTELVLPPLTAAEILADAAEEDLLTQHSRPVTVEEKRELVRQRELVRWREFREASARAEEEEQKRVREEDEERVAMGKKSRLVKVGGGVRDEEVGGKRVGLADERFVVFGAKVTGKGMEQCAPGARY